MDIFERFKKSLKIRNVLIDNEVFQLHYRATAILLFASALMVASKQHFGDPINCINRDDVPNKVMNTYCWIHSTFTLDSACNKSIGFEVPHPCVDKSYDKEERVYHKYYQWVYFMLFFQACAFYAPHFVWKMNESKLLLALTDDYKDPLSISRGGDWKKMKSIVKYISREHNRHNMYFYYFTLCELTNFLNVILQMYVVDEFLGGTFTSYGLDVLSYLQVEQEDRIDPMARVFPKMTKCSFSRFGSSGDVQKHDALCILPLNIINEKIYVFMWFWFVFLGIVTGLWLIYRLMTYLNPKLRYQIIRRRATHTNSRQLEYVLSQLDVGDWFLLSMISKNMDYQWYRILIMKLSKKLSNNEQIRPVYNAQNSYPRAGDDTVLDIDNSFIRDDDSDDQDETSKLTDISQGKKSNEKERAINKD